MNSTIEITQRLDRLSIVTNGLSHLAEVVNGSSSSNGPSSPIAIQPTVSSETATQPNFSGQFQHQSSPTSHSQTSGDVDTNMTDVIAGTASLTIYGNPVQHPQPLDSHNPQHSEQHTPRNNERHRVTSMAMAHARARQAAAAQASRTRSARASRSSGSPTLDRSRPHRRPSRHSGDRDASRFFRQREEIHAARMRRRSQAISQAIAQAYAARAQRHLNMFRAQMVYAQQMMATSAIMAGRSY